MPLDRDKILALRGRKSRVQVVDHPRVVEFFGEPVHVRVMGGTERDSYEESNMEVRRVGNKTDVRSRMTGSRARLVVRCLSDEQGNRLLKDEDAGVVGTFDGEVLDALVDACQQINGLTRQAEEDALKNSESDRNGNSGSGSPVISV